MGCPDRRASVRRGKQRRSGPSLTSALAGRNGHRVPGRAKWYVETPPSGVSALGSPPRVDDRRARPACNWWIECSRIAWHRVVDGTSCKRRTTRIGTTEQIGSGPRARRIASVCRCVSYSDPFGLCPNPTAVGLGSLQCAMEDMWEGIKSIPSQIANFATDPLKGGFVGSLAMTPFTVIGGEERVASKAINLRRGRPSALTWSTSHPDTWLVAADSVS
jgi:hypothetical protein